MKRVLFLLISTCTLSLSYPQETFNSQNWKVVKNDFSVNFYDVCKIAEAHFDTIDISKKGSGWKAYQRWRAENEFKYYPDGNRNNVDPYHVKNEFEQFNQNTATANRLLFPSGWQELGPTSPGQITGHHSFGMGQIVSFYVDPNNDQRLYIGTHAGGFWKSVDGGTTWTGGLTDFLPAAGVNTIAVSPTNPDSILININTSSDYSGGTSHGIYRSTDGGNTWTQSNFNPSSLGWGGLGTNDKIYKIRYHPLDTNLIFIATDKGLYRSEDNLTTWTTSFTNKSVWDIEFHPTDPDIVYSRLSIDTIFVSADRGLSFTPTSIPGSGFGRIKVSADCPNCVYFLTYFGLYKSTDSGNSFTQVSTPGLSPGGFAVSDVNDSIILAGYVDAFLSTDGGLNFSQVTEWALNFTNGAGNGHQISYNTSTNYIHADLQTADCINGVFYAATDGFLVKSIDNGINWQILSEDIGIRMNYNLGVSQSNHDRTICGSQDNGTSIHTENGWVEMFGADGMEGLIHPLNHDWMMSSIQNGGRLKTIDAGQTLALNYHPYYNAYWIAPMFYDPNNQMRIYSLGDKVFVTEEFGDGYTDVGTPFSLYSDINYASIAENNSNLLVATHFENIKLSNDAGITWTDIRGTLPAYFITDVVFDPKNDSTIIVTYGRYQNDNAKVFITHDLGSNWQNITYNLGNMPVRSVIVDHTNASTIYLGTQTGVFKKTMSDSLWSLYNTDLPNVAIKELDIMWGSNTLRASTWGRGLWEFTLDGRTNYPAITRTEITDPPTLEKPKVNVDQFVTSTILYDDILSSVYLEWSADTAVFGNTITMNNTSGNDWVSGTALPNFPAGTKMYFKVFAVGNSNDTTETYKFMYTVRNPYCAASGTPINNDSSLLYLAHVSLENLNNSSLNNLYTLYNNPVVSLYEGATYTISDSIGGVYTNGLGHKAWIDFNNDTEFSADEIIMSDSPGGISASGTFAVPYGIASSDSLRMRVRISFGYTSLYSLNPCGLSFGGEVEDYWVQVNPAPPPPILNFTLSGDTLCGGDSIIVTYTGASIDSLKWHISNGTTTLSGNNSTETFAVDSVGIYGVSLHAYVNTLLYTLDSVAAFQVFAPSTGIDVQTSCDSYTWIDGNTYTASNTSATDTLFNIAGCDSVVTLDLTIINSTTGIDTQVSCNPFTWIDGITYTASNDSATFILMNNAGCDSVVTLDLTINSNFGTDSQTACNSYTWIDGNTYTSSNNTATHTLVNTAGCDSVVTLNLTLNSVTASVFENNLVLTAIPPGANYQWIDCSDNNASNVGESNQSFTPSLNGSYAVIITLNGCSDTSDCFEVSTIGLEENDYADMIIYPNPSSGSFTIEFYQSTDLVGIEIFDMSGKVIHKNDKASKITKLNFDLDFASGTYFVSLKTKEKTKIVPIIIE